MATTRTTKKKTTRTTRKAQSNTLQWNVEDFTPEWASEGIERLSQAIEELTDELQSRADELQSRGEKLRKDGQKRFDKRVKKIQTELRKRPAVKRAEEMRADFEKSVEKNLDALNDRVYSTLGVAQHGEVKKLERKIAQLNKKIRTLEKAQAA